MTNDTEMGDDLEITSVNRRDAGGAWVRGTMAGHDFAALAFPDHAEHPEYEIGQSRISKLWLQRRADKVIVFDWDRGESIPAVDATAQAIVDFLCEGVADLAFGGDDARS